MSNAPSLPYPRKAWLPHGPMRFSFIRPQNTVFPNHYSEHLPPGAGGEGPKEGDVPEGPRAGKGWRALLT